VGDQLQEAVNQAAKEWGPHRLSDAEALAIKKALERGKGWLARLLERQARGRFVEDQVSKRFSISMTSAGTRALMLLTRRRAIGTDSLGYGVEPALHGRRMSGEFFRCSPSEGEGGNMVYTKVFYENREMENERLELTDKNSLYFLAKTCCRGTVPSSPRCPQEGVH
jgi:hypothetical protein